MTSGLSPTSRTAGRDDIGLKPDVTLLGAELTSG
jgi:hypothetical protein